MTSVTYDVYARDRASKSFNSVGHSALSMGNLSKKAALGIAGVGVAVAAVATAAAVFTYKVGSTYVASLNQIQALTGANNKQMTGAAKQLESNAGLYAKMGQTTGDAAAGVVELTKAGLSLHDSLSAVNATMVLAKAGQLSVADASTLVANSLNTFGLKAKDAGKIANQLANAANISSADVSDLAESFKYVAPIAAQSGVKMAQVNAILAELSNSGIKASNAGTGLRKFLLSLQAPSGAAAADLAALNVHIFDATGKMKPLGDVIGQLKTHMAGLSDQAKSKDLKDIFGLQGMASAQVILKGGKQGLDEYTKGVNKAGAAQRLANAQSKGLAGTFSTIKAEVTSAAQSFYREFSPAIDKALKPLATWLGKVSTQAAPALKQAMENMAPTLQKVGTFVSTQVVPALQKFGTWVKHEGAPAVLDLAQKVGHNLKPTLDQMLTTGRKMLPTVLQLGKAIFKAAPPVIDLATKIAGKLMPWLIRLQAFIQGPQIKALTMVVRAVGTAAGAMVDFGGKLKTAGQNVAQFVDAVKTKVGQAIGYVKSIPGKVTSAVGNLGHLLFDAGSQVVQGLIDGIESKVGGLVSKLHSITHLIPIHKGPIDKDRILLKPAGVAIMEGLISGIESQKVQLARVLTAVTSQVQAANAKLKAAVSSRNQFAAGFQSFTSSAFGMTLATDANGNDVAPTAAGIIAYQKQQRAQAHTVKTDVRKLIKMGLSPALIKQLQGAGASGIAEIQALANATPSQIRQYNALNKQTSRDLQSAGMAAGNRLYGREIRQDRRGLHESQELRKAMEALAHAFRTGAHVTVTLNGHHVDAELEKERKKNGGRLKSDKPK